MNSELSKSKLTDISVLKSEGIYFPLVKSFLDNQNSKQTRLQYQSDLKNFASYLSKRFPEINSVVSVSRHHLIRFKTFLEASQFSPSTINRRISAVSAYLRFLAQEELIQKDITYGVKRPKSENKKETAVFSKEEVLRLVASIDTANLSGKLHKAVCLILLGTGIRTGALRGIRIGDIYKEKNIDVVRIKTKGAKVSVKVLLPEVTASIFDYLNSLKAGGVVLKDTDFVFQAPPKQKRGLSGAPISSKVVSEIVKKYAVRIGCVSGPAQRYCAHSCRSTFATHLLESGVDSSDIQFELDHSSIQTTVKYLKRARVVENSPVLKLRYFS